MRLGFSIRVYGAKDLPSHDARSPQEGRHLSVSLAYLRDILLYLRANAMHMYRMHSALAPRPTLDDPSAWRAELAENAHELAAVGQLAREAGIRLSFHPYSAVTLNALNEEQAEISRLHLHAHTALLDAMGLGPEALVVLHAGGVYDNLVDSRERFVARYHALPDEVRRRVALEHDDRRFAFADICRIHQATEVPLVFDNLHHLVHNPDGTPTYEALSYCLSTWPAEVAPKVHFSSPRTEMRPLEGSGRIKMPTWTEHSDFANPFEFIAFLRLAEGLRPFDVMLESKARDLALLKLREDLMRFAPDLAARWS
ncbi:MAG: UV DNA damage repair endonuclease UvsE [Anaerolineae bacterium]